MMASTSHVLLATIISATLISPKLVRKDIHARAVSGGGKFHDVCSTSSKFFALHTLCEFSSKSSCTLPSFETCFPNTFLALLIAATQPAHKNCPHPGTSPS